jgi:hypothetical protein
MAWYRPTSVSFVCGCVLTILAASASRAIAQPALNPTKAVFSPSPDHNATLPDGTPVVASYRLDLFLSGASAPFQSNPLGKPSPDTSGIITVDLTSILVGWPIAGTVYVADVAAVGPGGSAASALSNTFSFGTACTYTASPTSNGLTASGGTGSVGVTAGSGCGWTGVSNASWITVTSGASGTGNGTVNYSVAANATTSVRTGTLTVAGQTITVTESGACSFTASPASQSLTASGGTGSVAVTAGSGCGWTDASNVSWITVTSGASGSGNGTVNYSVAVNASATPRTGTLTVAGKTITVTEAAEAAPAPPTNVMIKR